MTGYGPKWHNFTSSGCQISILQVRGPKWHLMTSLRAAGVFNSFKFVPYTKLILILLCHFGIKDQNCPIRVENYFSLSIWSAFIFPRPAMHLIHMMCAMHFDLDFVKLLVPYSVAFGGLTCQISNKKKSIQVSLRTVYLSVPYWQLELFISILSQILRGHA